MIKEKKVTIRDVAEKAGVSVSTVHRSLQNKEGVGEELREKVKKAASELGYEPNYYASTMKRKSKKIAVILPQNTNKSLYYSYIWEGIRAYGLELGNLNLQMEEFVVKDEWEQLKVFKGIEFAGEDTYAGVLSYYFSKRNEREALCLVEKGIKTLLLDDSEESHSKIMAISPEEKIIGKVAGEFISLLLPEKTSVIVTSGRTDSKTHVGKIKSFKQTLKKNKPQVNIIEIKGYYDPTNQNKKLYEKLEDALKNEPTVSAIFASTSYDNAITVEVVKNLHLEDRIQIIGSDVNLETKVFLEKHEVVGVVHTGPYEKGYEGLRTLTDSILRNEFIEIKNHIPVNIVLESNLEFYLHEARE